jgi:hypothetical protein
MNVSTSIAQVAAALRPQTSQKIEQLQGTGGVTRNHDQHERYRQSALDANVAAALERLELAAVWRGVGRQFRIIDIRCRCVSGTCRQ